MALSRLSLIVMVSALLGGCETERDSLCTELNVALEDCFGQDFTGTDCSAMSNHDLRNMTAALTASTCSAIREATPIDGDWRSARCQTLGEGCVEAINPAPIWNPTRYPILLVNGIDVSPLFRYSTRIVDTLRGIGGHDVHLVYDTPYDTPPMRAMVLWNRIQEIREETGAAKVNLICHSLGGLDCRYLVSPGGLHWDVDATEGEMASSVASITTISTAHRGTPVADMALGLLPDGDVNVAIDSLVSFFGDTFTPGALDDDTHLRASIQSLSTAESLAFDATVPDAPGIYYQSYAAFSRPYGIAPPGHDSRLAELCRASDGGDGLESFHGVHDHMALNLVPSSEIVDEDRSDPTKTVPNDGLVPIESARWGNFRGCIPADHMEQLGQLHLPDVNVRTGFDIARFYAEVASDLANRGF